MATSRIIQTNKSNKSNKSIKFLRNGAVVAAFITCIVALFGGLI